MAAGRNGLRLLRVCGESSFYSIVRRSLHCTCPKWKFSALGMVKIELVVVKIKGFKLQAMHSLSKSRLHSLAFFNEISSVH